MFLSKITSNYHADYLDVTQHWNKNSESYAGGDALVTLLLNGWKLDSNVSVETKWYTGMRQGLIYHMVLVRDDEKITIPVINNPYITRLVIENDLDITHMTDQEIFSKQ